MIAVVLRRAALVRRRAGGPCLRAGRGALFAAVAILPALAGDRPATADGARAIQSFFDRMVPAPAGALPFVSVKPDGDALRVSADLSAINGLLKGVTYEPATLVFRLFGQDDGKWRVVQDALPRIVSRSGNATSVLEMDNYHQTLVVDPALAWWTSGEAAAGKGRLTTQTPKVDQTFDFGALKGAYATTVTADGAVSSTIRQEFGDVAFKIASTGKDGDPVSSSGRAEMATINVGVEGLKSRKLFDLVSFYSAHRSDLAAHEAELKDLLRPFALPGLRLVEGGEATKLMLASPLGAIALSSAKLALAVTNAGPDSAVDATVAAEGLSLPAGIVPQNAAELTPSKADLAFTVKGIDIASAASQAIETLHFDGPVPRIPEADLARVTTALIGGSGPLKIVLAPSHVLAPALDADLEGEIRYLAGKTAGAVTVRMRGFDRTMNAVKDLGPEIAAKSLPMVAMAKAIAKTESDGALSWRIEVGDDRSIKVNGVPLGKAPN